jgi:hypothetical protein
MCQQLGVLVQAGWQSCNLATPAFRTNWEPIAELARLEKSFSLGCATPQVSLKVESQLKSTEEQVAC